MYILVKNYVKLKWIFVFRIDFDDDFSFKFLKKFVIIIESVEVYFMRLVCDCVRF